MKNAVLKDIEDYAIARLTQAYGFAGAAKGDDMSHINSSDHAGNDIKIVITIKAE